MNFGSIDLVGAKLVDKTTHVVEITHPDHEPFVLAIWQAPLPAGKALHELVAERLAEDLVRLPGFKILSEVDVDWEGTLARDAATRWRHQGRVVYGRQAHLAVRGQWIAFALTGPLESRPTGDAWFDEIMQSFTPAALH